MHLHLHFPMIFLCAFTSDICARQDALPQRMQRPHGCSAATASAGLAPQAGELLTPDTGVDIMSTHENHQANTS
jgi:hypothetical protein